MNDRDVSNFTSSSSHRLPTVSASEALIKLSGSESSHISTGLPQLDQALQASGSHSAVQNGSPGGLPRGQVTEIYGPPGVGKTTFAMQATSNTLHAGNSVLWIDTGSPIVGPRLADIVSQSPPLRNQEPPSSPPMPRSLNELLNDFHYFFTPTLPHLIALLTFSSPSIPPEATSLIVVDAISSLFATAFPRAVERDDSNKATAKKSEAVQWAANRRWSIMSDVLARLAKLAAIRNISVILLSQTTTKVKTEYGAVLRPAISTKAWEDGLNNRILLFRDWAAREADLSSQQSSQILRFAGVVRLGGVSYEGVGRVVPFIIGTRGLQEVTLQADVTSSATLPILPGPTLKRKREEIADSESEEEEIGSDKEFGWAGDDPLAVEILDNDATILNRIRTVQSEDD